MIAFTLHTGLASMHGTLCALAWLGTVRGLVPSAARDSVTVPLTLHPQIRADARVHLGASGLDTTLAGDPVRVLAAAAPLHAQMVQRPTVDSASALPVFTGAIPTSPSSTPKAVGATQPVQPSGATLVTAKTNANLTAPASTSSTPVVAKSNANVTVSPMNLPATQSSAASSPQSHAGHHPLKTPLVVIAILSVLLVILLFVLILFKLRKACLRRGKSSDAGSQMSPALSDGSLETQSVETSSFSKMEPDKYPDMLPSADPTFLAHQSVFPSEYLGHPRGSQGESSVVAEDSISQVMVRLERSRRPSRQL